MSDMYEKTNTPGIYKDVVTKKYWIKFDYRDFTGERRTIKKRGFNKIRDALDFKIDFLQNQASSSSIRFKAFYHAYIADMSKRLRKNTVENKKYIIELKILPYFGQKKLNEITPRDIRMWQSTLLKENYKETYLKTINNQLSAMFNYACRFYGLSQNPCKLAGSMGKSKADEMEIFTKDEFETFLNCLYDKPESHLAFEILFYTGMRVSELLALTIGDIDFSNKTIVINKSLHRVKGVDIVSEPKTPKSNRVISIPAFLSEDIKDYLNRLYDTDPDNRLFSYNKHYLDNEFRRGLKSSGIQKNLHIHSIRHSHTALLFELGYNILEIRDRLGHEKVETTLNIYTHLYPNKQEKIADGLNRLEREGISNARIKQE